MLKADAVKFFGTEAQLARALGINQSAIQAWGDVIPRGSACELELITAHALQVDWTLYKRRRVT